MLKFKIEDMTVKLKEVPIQSIGKNMCDEVSFVKKERLDEMIRIMKNNKILLHPSDYNRFLEGGVRSGKDRTYIENMFSSEPLEKKDLKLEIPFRKNYMSFAGTTLFQENISEVILGLRNYDTKGEKEMKVGLPYSVNFVEKHKRTTLVWHDEKIMVNYDWDLVSEENYETTKSEAHNEKFNHLFGFLMAYFKRVHQGKSKTQIKKYLNTVVYPMKQKEQLAFLQGVFYENCGLNYKEAKAYLDKVEKGENVNA
jgi:hypothetical protein